MYSIYVDGICVSDDTVPLQELKLFKPKLTMSENLAGSLDITIPPTNVGYSLIKKMISEVAVRRDGIEIWSGRPLTDSEDFQNDVKILCEGELAYLNDSIQPPTEYHQMTVAGFLGAMLTHHNAQVESDKYYTVGIVTVTDPNNSLYRYTNYESTMTCINEKLLKQLGGHLKIRKVNGVRYLDYLAEYPNTNTQTIEFGKNLLDFSKYTDMADFATVIIPLGEKLNTSSIEALPAYLTVAEVNNGSIFVESAEAIATYGRIVKTVNWDDVTEPQNLLIKANLYLQAIQFENVSFELQAVDLHNANINIEAINMLDQIRAVSEPHGMNALFPITKIIIPLDDPESMVIDCGNTKQMSISSVTTEANQQILAKLELLPNKNQMLEEIQTNASKLIATALNGFVTVVQGQNGSQELLITDEADYTVATKVWRWNINGLGYSSNGYEGPYNTAMTMDGSIVGDRIAGTLLVGSGLEIKTSDGTFRVDENGFYCSQFADFTTAEQVDEHIAQSINSTTGAISMFVSEKTALNSHTYTTAPDKYQKNDVFILDRDYMPTQNTTFQVGQFLLALSNQEASTYQHISFANGDVLKFQDSNYLTLPNLDFSKWDKKDAYQTDKDLESAIDIGAEAIIASIRNGALSASVEFDLLGGLQIYNSNFSIWNKPKTDSSKVKSLYFDEEKGNLSLNGSVYASGGKIGIWNILCDSEFKSGLLATSGINPDTGEGGSLWMGRQVGMPFLSFHSGEIYDYVNDDWIRTTHYVSDIGASNGSVYFSTIMDCGPEIPGNVPRFLFNNPVDSNMARLDFDDNYCARLTTLIDGSYIGIRPDKMPVLGRNNEGTDHLVFSSNVPYIQDGDNYLHVQRDMKTAAGLIYDICDIKLKKNITKISPNKNIGLELIKRIEFVEFDFKDTNKHVDVGMIAQQLEALNEQLVVKVEQPKESPYYDETGIDNVIRQPNTYQILTHLIMAVQQLTEIVDEQSKVIKRLEGGK